MVFLRETIFASGKPELRVYFALFGKKSQQTVDQKRLQFVSCIRVFAKPLVPIENFLVVFAHHPHSAGHIQYVRVLEFKVSHFLDFPGRLRARFLLCFSFTNLPDLVCDLSNPFLLGLLLLALFNFARYSLRLRLAWYLVSYFFFALDALFLPLPASLFLL